MKEKLPITGAHAKEAKIIRMHLKRFHELADKLEGKETEEQKRSREEDDWWAIEGKIDRVNLGS